MQCDLSGYTIGGENPLLGLKWFFNVSNTANCLSLCISLKAVSYKHNYYDYVCSCYSIDCCAYAGKLLNPVPAVNYVMATIGICDDIFASQHGSVSRIGPYYETASVTFTCVQNSFTSLIQSSVVYKCQSTGQWSPNFTPCISTCNNQFSTATGSINFAGPFMPGSYTFTCLSGYLTVGKTTADIYVCTAGIWNQSFKPCLPTCSNIFISTSGLVNPGAPFSSGSTYTFSCKSTWLTSSLLSSETYSCINGIWNKPFSPCYAVCPNIFDTTGSIGPAPYMGFPKIYTFTCIPGYLLPSYATSQQYTCQSGGSWNPAQFTACIKECQPVVRPQTAMTISYNGPFVHNLVPSGLSANFDCGINYTKWGTNRPSNCYNGNWDMSRNQMPKCLANCKQLDTNSLFDRLTVNYTNTNPIINGTVAIFTCSDSYHLYGDFAATNCVNGSWDLTVADLPICLEQQVANYDAKTLKGYADLTGKDKMVASGIMTDMISYIISNLSTSMKSSTGFSSDDNLISCIYGDRLCNKRSEVLGFYDNHMGNCYSFNHKYMNESILAERVGEGEGLHLVFDSKQEEFMSLLPTGGLKLIVHQSFDPIFPDSMGIKVSPGFNYIIAVHRKKETRVETPKSICYNSPSRAQTYFVENVTYAIEACQRSYYQPGIIDKCGCASPNLPSANCNCTVCQLDKRNCVADHLNFINQSDPAEHLINACPASCDNTVEQLTVTMTGNAYKSQLFDPKKYNKHYQMLNMITVKVYFASLQVTLFKERISYTVLDLINDMASSIGVIVGMSAISLVELIVVAVQFVHYPIKIMLLNRF